MLLPLVKLISSSIYSNSVYSSNLYDSCRKNENMSAKRNASSQKPLPDAIRPIQMGLVNWIGLQTLYIKEVLRFMKVSVQTLLGPAITATLFMMVFAVAFGERAGLGNNDNYVQFLAPGLIMMIVLQNAFANTSSSLISAKLQGNIVDLLMPPLGAGEIIVAMLGGALTRCILISLICVIIFILFDAIILPPHPLLAIFFLVSGATAMALSGMIAGIWVRKFDQLSAITNFVIQPLTFLSGTFYSIQRLPTPFDTIASYNPVFIIIDGFRYGMTGLLDSHILVGICLLSGVNVLLFIICYYILATGFRLKN